MTIKMITTDLDGFPEAISGFVIKEISGNKAGKE